MRAYIFIFLALFPEHHLFSQNQILNTNGECKGIYWLDKSSDYSNPDSIRIVGSIKRVTDILQSEPYCVLIINN